MGGDDLCNVAADVIAAMGDGYQMVVWYGKSAEVLIAGYRPMAVVVNSEPEPDIDPEDDQDEA